MPIVPCVALLPKFHHKGDGYNVFRPEAERFVALNGKNGEQTYITEIEAVKMSGTIPLAEKREETAKRRAQTLASFDGVAGLRHVAAFCHGWSTGLQLGFDTKTAQVLAATIAKLRAPTPDNSVHVTLYSCSCGNGGENGDGGFADELRDALCRFGATGCVVDAHTTIGHSTMNPFVRRFEGRGSHIGGVGGSWIVEPYSKLWTKWRRALRTTDLRLRYTRMSIAKIHAEVDALK